MLKMKFSAKRIFRIIDICKTNRMMLSCWTTLVYYVIIWV